GDKFWVYPPEEGQEYPKLLQEKFPGIPFPLDAAVECHRGECANESVFFFQGRREFQLSSGCPRLLYALP
ncbi:HPX, partial [Cervus elaphus hippelaphus]